MTTRPLTPREIALTRSVFHEAIDPSRVTIRHSKWFPFQPRETVMAPCGHLHFHPRTSLYQDDFGTADLSAQGLFIHEMTHVWQSQHRGRYYLPLMRHPFCRYRYTLREGWPLDRYGLEQQAEIVRHAFLGRLNGRPSAPSTVEQLERLLPF